MDCLAPCVRQPDAVMTSPFTALQIILIALTLARLGFAVDDHGMGSALVLAVATTTVASGSAYLVRWARSLAGAEEAQ